MKQNLLLSLMIGISSLNIGCCNKETPKAENQVTETIMQRRSIRKYLSKDVEKEKLEEIAKCGIHAPNGMGLQSWEIRIVTNKEWLSRLDNSYSIYMKEKNGKETQYAAYNAPALVFIACDTTYELSQIDCGLLGENMILAAQSMGIGSCCLGSTCRFVNAEEGKEFLEELDFPENYRLLYAIAFGYPDENPECKPRNYDKIKFIE